MDSFPPHKNCSPGPTVFMDCHFRAHFLQRKKELEDIVLPNRGRYSTKTMDNNYFKNLFHSSLSE